MHVILQNLLKLQVFDFDNPSDKNQAEVEQLRGVIPQPFLGHYDRLKVRGKKGLAIVRNQVCTGCHMRLPIGTITMLMRGEEVQLCDSCGRYLVLADEGQTSTPPVATEAPPAVENPPVKRQRKPRKAKAVVETV